MNENIRWLLIKIALIIGVVGTLGYGIYLNKQKSLDISQFDKDSIIAANDQNGQVGDAVLGNPNAPVKVIEYGDYQCPACGRNRKIFENLVQQYPDKVVLIFRHFIIPGHTDARLASGVAIAASRQGKFWEMHDKIFENTAEWVGQGDKREAIFQKYAEELGLNIEQYKTDLNSSQINQKINFDMELGRAHKLSGTPTIIVNGESVSSTVWSDSTKFKQFIESKFN